MTSEQKVKAKWPDAVVDHWPVRTTGVTKMYWPCKYCIKANPKGKYNDISGMHDTEKAAWSQAAKNIEDEQN